MARTAHAATYWELVDTIALIVVQFAATLRRHVRRRASVGRLGAGSRVTSLERRVSGERSRALIGRHRVVLVGGREERLLVLGVRGRRLAAALVPGRGVLGRRLHGGLLVVHDDGLHRRVRLLVELVREYDRDSLLDERVLVLVRELPSTLAAIQHARDDGRYQQQRDDDRDRDDHRYQEVVIACVARLARDRLAVDVLWRFQDRRYQRRATVLGARPVRLRAGSHDAIRLHLLNKCLV